MADQNFNVSVLFQLRDKLSGQFSAMTNKFEGFQKNLKKSGTEMKRVGKTMSTRLSLPIVAMGGFAVATAAKFDDSMRKVKAITKATGDDFQAMRDLAMKMGRDTAFTASEAAQGMTFLGMAGLDVREIMEALPNALQLAAAGGITLAESADIATNVMTSMGKETKDLAHINDVLAFAQSKSNTSILELAEALRPVAGTASSMGVSLEQTVSMLGKLADAGEKGSIAGTLLRQAMVEFVKKGNDINDFTKRIEELKNGTIDVTQIYEDFGRQGGRAILALTKSGGNEIDNFTEKLKNSDGTAKEAQKTMEQGLGGSLRKMGSALNNLSIVIGDVIAPALLAVIDILIPIFKWFASLSSGIKIFIVVVMALVAAAGPLLVVVGQLSIAMGALNVSMLPTLGTVLAIAVAVGTLIIAIKKLRDLTSASGEREALIKEMMTTGLYTEDQARKLANEKYGKVEDDGFNVGNMINKQVSDINLNIQTDPGVTASIGSKRDRGGGSNVNAKIERGMTIEPITASF